MKKVLSLVLVLTLVLGSFGFAFADTAATTTATAAKTTATPKDVVGTDFEGAVTALSALGVVSGYEDGNYKPANIVTRAEMAKLIIAELGLEANATGAKSTFKDMAGYGWAEGYIGYAQSLGIINGYGDGTFKPGKTVSYDEALTMIVSALGYTKACKEMNGSWPAIFVQKARVLGITDDVKAGGAAGANRGDIAIYLYNMLTADMGYADADGVYVTKKDKNNDPIKVITNLDAEESTDGYDGYNIITKTDADDALVNIKPFVGACAKVFKINKGKNDGKIIAISDVKSTFITGEFKAGTDKKLVAADGTEYKLDDVMTDVAGTSTEKYFKEISKNFKAYEFINGDQASNGSTVLDNSGTKFDENKNHTIVTIAADLSGKTVKGVYSVMMWGKVSGTNGDAVAERVDADDLKSITANKTLLGKDFTQDDNDEIDMTSFELIGVGSLADIKADNIVYVYTGGTDKEITRVAVGTEVVKGEVSKIKEDDTNVNSKITVNGKEYLIADEKLDKNSIDGEFAADDVDTGDQVELYLDAYGYIYDYEATSGKAANYAIVLETGDGSHSIGAKHEIKLFLADGTDKVFNVDGDLFDGGKDSVVDVTTKDAWTVSPGAIVKYGVDKDGVIDSFEAFRLDKKGELVKDYKYLGITTLGKTPNTGNYKLSDITKTGYFNGYEIKNDAVMFSFNGKANLSNVGTAAGQIDITDEDEYGTTKLEKVLDKSDIEASYVTYKNKIVAMLLYDFSDSDNLYGVVTGARKTSGSSDYEIDMLVNGAKKTYPAKEKAYEIARKSQDADTTAGDKLFRLDFNAGQEIKDLVWAGHADELTSEDTITYGAITLGSDSECKNNVFSVGTGTSDKVGYFSVANNNTSARLDKNAQVYYNDKGDFAAGTLSDLKGLKAGSIVWVFDTEDDHNDLMNIVVVYKKDAAATNPSTPSITDGVYTVDYVNSTRLVVNGTTYKLNDDSTLYDAQDKFSAMGGASITGKITSGTTKVTDIKATDGVVNSFRLASTDATIATATAAGKDIKTELNADGSKVLPYGSTVPTVAVTTTSKHVKVEITQATALTASNNVATVKVTAEDGTVVSHTITFTAATIDAASSVSISGAVAVNTDATVTVVLKDSGTNPVTGLTASDFVVTKKSGTGTLTFGTVTETTAGTYTFTVKNDTAATTAVINVTVKGVSLTTEPTLTTN